MFCTHGHVVYILLKMGSWALTRCQVFSQSRFRYGFHLIEFWEQKSALVQPLVDTKQNCIYIYLGSKNVKNQLGINDCSSFSAINRPQFWVGSPITKRNSWTPLISELLKRKCHCHINFHIPNHLSINKKIKAKYIF